MITVKHFLTVLLLLLALSSCSPTADITLPVISAVNAAYVGNSSAIITWTTDKDTTSQVEYGTTDTYGSTTTLDRTYTKSHGVELTDLDPDTTYYFRVISKDTSGNDSISAGETLLTDDEEISTIVKNGDTVKVHYKGTLDDGTEFDSSYEREPLEFTVGDGGLLSGFELAVIGMLAGQSKTFTILAEDAYGLYDDELVDIVNRDELSSDLELEIGQELTVYNQGVPVGKCTVIEISESTVTLDFNHHLAGEDLTFEIELVEIL